MYLLCIITLPRRLYIQLTLAMLMHNTHCLNAKVTSNKAPPAPVAYSNPAPALTARQWRLFKFKSPCAKCPGSGTEIIPGRHSDTRIKNKASAFDQRPWPLHKRYTRTDTCLRWVMAVAYNRYKFITASILKRFRNGRFTSETDVWLFQKRNSHLDPEVV
jgi:hypothetical protein